MTQLNISFEEAKKLAHVELSWFHAKGYTGKVRGGFVRDSFLGVPVKDMDIYLPTRDHDTKEQIEALAKEFYEARGHEYILHKHIKRRDAEDDSPYNEFLTVFQSQNVAEGDFPVDLIFTPAGYDHPGNFDFGICEQSFWILPFQRDTIHHNISRDAQRDIDNKTLTFLRVEDGLFEMMNGYRPLENEQFEKAYERALAHLERIKEKYPEYKLVVDLATPAWGDPKSVLHARLKEDGIIGQAGEILPTEASIAERDQVRQFDREDLVRIVRGEDPRADVQAGEATVQRAAQLQPGLFDLDRNDFIEQVLAAARQREAQRQPTRVRTLRPPVPRNNGPRNAFGALR